MATLNTPKNWKLTDIDYRTRYLLYQMLTVPKAKDRNKDKAYAAVITAIKNGDEDLLPAMAIDGELVQRFGMILRAEGLNEDAMRFLARALTATKDSHERTTIYIAKGEIETALEMYDEFLKEANKEGSQVANLGRVENTHRVIPVIEALENAKAGTATPGMCEPVKLDGAADTKPEAGAEATA